MLDIARANMCVHSYLQPSTSKSMIANTGSYHLRLALRIQQQESLVVVLDDREDARCDEPPDEEASLNIPTPAPTLNVGPAPSPSFQLASASLPQTTPQSGPVDRTRYAAMFPNDPASALIRQGIGSMMG